MSSESSVLCATNQNSIIWHRAHRYFKHWSAWKESLWLMKMIPTHLEKLSWGTRGDLFSCSMASWGEGAGKGSTRLGGLPGLGWGLIMIKHIIRDRYSGIFRIKVCSFWPKRGLKKASGQVSSSSRHRQKRRWRQKACCVCSFIDGCRWTIQILLSMSELLFFFDLQSFYGIAFNLYNPEYLSLLYNIYFTFLLRGVFKTSLREIFTNWKIRSCKF